VADSRAFTSRRYCRPFTFVKLGPRWGEKSRSELSVELVQNRDEFCWIERKTIRLGIIGAVSYSAFRSHGDHLVVPIHKWSGSRS
jgi:hypothetical protein